MLEASLLDVDELFGYNIPCEQKYILCAPQPVLSEDEGCPLWL